MSRPAKNELYVSECSSRIRTAMAYYKISRQQVISLTGLSLDEYGSGLHGRSMVQLKKIEKALLELGVPEAWFLVEETNVKTLELVVLSEANKEKLLKEAIEERDKIAEEYNQVLQAYLGLKEN